MMVSTLLEREAKGMEGKGPAVVFSRTFLCASDLYSPPPTTQVSPLSITSSIEMPVFIPLHSGYLQDRNAAKSLRQLSVPWVDCHRKVRYTSNKYNSKH